MLSTPSRAFVQEQFISATAGLADAQIKSPADVGFAAMAAIARDFAEFCGEQIADTELAAALLRSNGFASLDLCDAIRREIVAGFSASGVRLFRGVEWAVCEPSDPRAISGKLPTKLKILSPAEALAALTPADEFARIVWSETHDIWEEGNV